MKKNLQESMVCALRGIVKAFRSERNLRIHGCCALIVLLTAILLKVSQVDFALLTLAIGLVIVTELVNTAIEKAIDLFSISYHPLAKIAKDVAAGAVLFAALSAVVIGFLVFGPYLWK